MRFPLGTSYIALPFNTGTQQDQCGPKISRDTAVRIDSLQCCVFGKVVCQWYMQCLLTNIILFTISLREICKYRFLKCQFYFSYILEKIANIRKNRKNDEYFPHSE